MKRVLVSIFLVCFVFSGIFYAQKSKDSAGDKGRRPAKNEFANIFRPIGKFPIIFRPVGNWFKSLFENRKKIIACPGHPWIENVTLGRPEMPAGCPEPEPARIKACSGQTLLIEVSAEGRSLTKGPIFYRYFITAGKITGEGPKVVWDLSNVKPGTYSITTAAYEVPELYGKTRTEMIEIVDCSKCLKTAGLLPSNLK